MGCAPELVPPQAKIAFGSVFVFVYDVQKCAGDYIWQNITALYYREAHCNNNRQHCLLHNTHCVFLFVEIFVTYVYNYAAQSILSLSILQFAQHHLLQQSYFK